MDDAALDVAVVGCGYVGLVSGVCLAASGHRVVGVEADPARRAAIGAGRPPFHEPGLAGALASALSSGAFSVSDDPGVVRGADVVLLAVQTPPRADGSIDLGPLRCAAELVGEALAGGEHRGPVVAVRSTVVPGTVETVVAPALAGTGAVAASNPEFLSEGGAVADFLSPDRVVIGCDDPRGVERLLALYAPLGGERFVVSPAAAELAKYASNGLLATMISFANEIGRVCEALPGVDVEDVLATVHADRRLSPRIGGERVAPGILGYLRAGCGFGGSCLPKDITALASAQARAGQPMPLLTAVAAINDGQGERLVDAVEAALGRLDGRKVAVLGLAFKAGTDDLRDSPGLRIAGRLRDRGATVMGYDPLVADGQVPPGIEPAATMGEAVSRADAVVVSTDDPAFRELACDVPVIDGRRDLSPAQTTAAYHGVGLGPPSVRA